MRIHKYLLNVFLRRKSLKPTQAKRKFIPIRPLSDKKVFLYQFISIVILIIPEYIANMIIKLPIICADYSYVFSIENLNNLAEIEISRMQIIELRYLAKSLKIFGYSQESRRELERRSTFSLRKWKSRFRNDLKKETYDSFK